MFAGNSAKMLLVALLTLAAGCGGGYELHPLSGSVTYEGEPVSMGQMVFIPDEEGGNQGPRTTVPIENGQYETPSGQGVVGGKYVVEIDGFEYDEASGDDEAEMIRLFPIRQVKVDLPESGGTFDFELHVDE